MMTYSGMIFDFNGVLLLDAHLQEAAWDRMAVRLRGAPFSRQEFRENVHGQTNVNILTYLTERQLSRAEIDRLSAEKEADYRRLCLEAGEQFALAPGAHELFSALQERDIPFTIATSSVAENVALYIEHFRLERWFDPARIVYDDGTRPGKPAPDIYVQAAHEIRRPAHHCVVAEDAVSGIAAAHAAGIGAIVAVGPTEEHARLTRLPGVTLTVEQLSQIPLERLFGRSPGPSL